MNFYLVLKIERNDCTGGFNSLRIVGLYSTRELAVSAIEMEFRNNLSVTTFGMERLENGGISWKQEFDKDVTYYYTIVELPLNKEI